MRRYSGRLALWLAALAWVALGAWHAVVAPLAPLQRLEWQAQDLHARSVARQVSGPHPDIVIVDIDEASLQAQGRWPWPRSTLAQLVDELFERQRVAVLGFDLVFAEPDDDTLRALSALAAQHPALQQALPTLRRSVDHDQALANALRGHRAVLGWYLSSDRGGQRAGQLPPAAAEVPGPAPTPGLPRWSGYGANLPTLVAAAPRSGFFNALADDDGVVRSVPALARVDDALYESLALAVWRAATGDPALTLTWRPRAPGQELAALHYRQADAPTAAATTTRRLSPDEHGALAIGFRGTGGPQGGSFRYVSAHTVLSHGLAPGALAGRIVLLGSSAPGLGDLRATPIHPALPGVEVHAHLLANLLDDRLPQRPSWAPGYEAGLTATLVLLATALAVGLAAPLALLAMAAVLTAVLLGTWWWQAGQLMLLPVAAPAAIASAQFMLAMLANQVREWRRRRTVESLFSHYLPPERVRQLVRHTDPEHITAENRELSVLFCDLQGFSALAEHLPPLALRDLLNRFFSDSTALIQAHDGTVDKFIGDAVMAFWGAPLPQADHATRAVQGAMALARGLGPLNAELAAQGLPTVGYGIGLASGLVCVGDLGSRLRRSYTAVGDAVNLAARLEALTRDTGVPLLVADSTHQLIDQSQLPDVLWLEVDECRVRGRAKPVTVFTPLQVQTSERSHTETLLHTWHLALAASRQQHAGLALGHLAHLDTLLAAHAPTAAAPAVLPGLVERLRARLQAPASGAAP